MSFIYPARERKRILLAGTLVCANVWRPERPKPVQETKGDFCVPLVKKDRERRLKR